jgi:hypothetical protein
MYVQPYCIIQTVSFATKYMFSCNSVTHAKSWVAWNIGISVCWGFVSNSYHTLPTGCVRFWRKRSIRRILKSRNFRRCFFFKRVLSARIEYCISYSTHFVHRKRLWWSRGSVLAFGTQVRRFAPGRSRRIFKAKKVNIYLPSLMMKVPSHLYVLGDTYTCHT